MGRFSVAINLANHYEVRLAGDGRLPTDQVRRAQLTGVVDTGAARLVVPAGVVAELGLLVTGKTMAKFGGGRRDEKQVVGDVELELQGRSGVYSAVVEPGRTDALIGAIVLEELDFLADCVAQRLTPRDPNTTITEVE